jgi:hypothetical protein
MSRCPGFISNVPLFIIIIITANGLSPGGSVTIQYYTQGTPTNHKKTSTHLTSSAPMKHLPENKTTERTQT